MTDESAKLSLTLVSGGADDARRPDPALAAESLDLMQAFIKIPSATDRQKVIELARRLSGSTAS